MAGEEIYIARLAAWIARALGEVSSFAEHLDTEVLGFQTPEAVAADPAVTAAGAALADAGEVLASAADAIDMALVSGVESELISSLIDLVQGIYLTVNAATQFADKIRDRAATLAGAERAAVEAFADKIARKVIDYSVISLLERQAPKLAYVLKTIGLIDWRVVEESGEFGEPRFVLKDTRFERLRDMFRDPPAHFASVYGWGTEDFDPHDIMRSALQFYHPERAVEAGKTDAGDAFIRFGDVMWRRDSNVSPPGLELDLSKSIRETVSERVEISDEWGATLSAELDLSGGIIFKVAPMLEMSLEPKTGVMGGEASFVFNRNPERRGFGIVDGNDFVRLVAEDFGFGAEIVVGAETSGTIEIDPAVTLDLEGLTLSLGAEGSDNFVASLLAETDIEGEFDLGLTWRLSDGMTVRAAGGLEIAIPMHQDLGVVRFDTLYLLMKIKDDASFSLETSAGVTGLLGPLTATIERIGAEATLSFKEGADGGFGAADLDLAFKPPTGVGLAIDAGAVRGGGYLFLDYEKGEYAGALELTIEGLMSLKAIGLINTKLPDGSDGFSLLIIITAEFGTPIQLGFGFTLLGVGGLLGLNRTMLLEEMAEGVRTGAIEGVMFPQDVVTNAPKIISDMRRFFPPLEGRFMIGPMAKIGWGTPTLVSLSLGVVFEIPPGNVAILGVLSVVLPDDENDLVVIKVKFIGAIEPDKERLWFFASLFESRIVFIQLDGEMGLLMAWGDDPNFVLAVGGLHPAYQPPPLPFPSPRRIAVSILNESFARIRIEGYFAVTSNTVQFGAAVDLFFGVSAFSVEGHLGFDALFQFSPFYFNIQISASVSVKVFGAGVFSVRIRGELEGTSPWHVEGEGRIRLLFFKIKVPFSHTWGESEDTVLPEAPVMPVLQAEFGKRENWIALPPTKTAIGVSLRKLEEQEGLVLHPIGALRVSQRAIPLNLGITKFGNQTIADISKATLDVSAAGFVAKKTVKEPFATAQFRDLSSTDKLSAPGFEKQDAGVDISVSGSDTQTSHAVKRVVTHELITIDTNYKEHIRKFVFTVKSWFTLLLGSNATALSVLSQQTARQKVPFDTQIRAVAPGFVLADMMTNAAVSGIAPFATHAQAQDALRAQLSRHPEMATSLHIIPQAEVQIAA